MATAMFPEVVSRIASAMRERGAMALLVGGSVRDMVLDIPPKDFDIEIYGMEAERLETVIGSLHPTWMDTVGRAFCVLKVKFGEVEIDLSIPRRESKSGAGHRDFQVVGDPWMTPREAARRRDFTMNALAYDLLTGEILDFFGGREDLAHGILRATDLERFRDDPLRVMRAAQFAGRFNLSVEQATLELCRQMVKEPEFAKLPRVRIGEEWRKLLLKSPRPSVGLEAVRAMGVLKVLHPELGGLVGCPQDPEWHPEGDVWRHTLMVVNSAADIVRREGIEGDDALVILLGAACHDVGKPATTRFASGRWRSHGHEAGGVEPTRSFLAGLELGKEIVERVAPMVAEHLFPANSAQASDSAIRRLARRLHPATVRELVLVAEADHAGRALQWDGFPAGTSLLKRAEAMALGNSRPVPILMGRHLMEALGWEPGPSFGKVLRVVLEAQLEGDVSTLKEALEMARKIPR